MNCRVEPAHLFLKGRPTLSIARKAPFPPFCSALSTSPGTIAAHSQPSKRPTAATRNPSYLFFLIFGLPFLLLARPTDRPPHSDEATRPGRSSMTRLTCKKAVSLRTDPSSISYIPLCVSVSRSVPTFRLAPVAPDSASLTIRTRHTSPFAQPAVMTFSSPSSTNMGTGSKSTRGLDSLSSNLPAETIFRGTARLNEPETSRNPPD